MKQRSLHQLLMYYASPVLGVVTLLSLVSFFLFRAWTIQYQTAQIEQSFQTKADDIARLVGFYREVVRKLSRQQNVVDLLVFGKEQEAFRWALGTRNLLPQNIGLALFNVQGKVLGSPVDLRVGESCIADMQNRIHGTKLRETPVHQNIARLAHFDVMENVVTGDETVGVIFASFSITTLQEELQRITGPAEKLVILFGQTQVIASAGDIAGRPMLLEKTLPIAGTDWQMKAMASEPPMNTLMLDVGLVALLMFLLMSATSYGCARRLVKRFMADMDNIQDLLAQVKVSHALPEQTMHSNLQETENIVQDIHHLASDILSYQQRMVDLSATDEMTGLLNRRAFDQQAKRCLALARRGMDISVVLLDLDYLKQVNDAHGHAMGDSVLKILAHCLQDNIRAVDVAARLGGDEFVVVLMQCTEQQAFSWYQKVAGEFESAQREMSGMAVAGRLCSISAGFTDVKVKDEDITAVLRRADAALYRAKDGGRARMSI